MTKLNGFHFDWTQIFGAYAKPKSVGVDMSKLMDLYKKNFETMTLVTRLGANCARDIARCHNQAVEQNLSNFATAIDVIANGNAPEQRIKKSAQIIQESLQASTANARELAQILTRSNREVFEVVGSRMRESVSDLQDIVPSADSFRKSASTKR